MIVEPRARTHSPDGRARLSARLRSAQLDGEVGYSVPEAFAAPADDATWALALALPLAAREREDLEVQGLVDPALLARAAEIVALYHAFDPEMAEIAVTAAGRCGPRPAAAAGAVCLSRGVDSTFAAAQGDFTHAVYSDGLEPIHGEATRRREIELAGELAAALGLELVVTGAEVRHVTELRFDWEDMCGAGLAALGHALSGGLGRLQIPSSDAAVTVGPCGTSPLLDPLFSGSALAVEHAPVTRTRLGKLEWLVRERPDVLGLVKVCYKVDSPDNCGVCGKCLHTMACLRLLGVLHRAPGFPDELDLEVLAGERVGQTQSRVEYLDLHERARAAGDTALATALDVALSRPVQLRPRPAGRRPRFRAQGDALRDAASGPTSVGLVRGLDLRARRHAYAAGRLPAGTPTAELGALATEPGAGRSPLWVLPDGRVATQSHRPDAPAPGRAARARFVAAALPSPLAARRALDLVLRPAAPAHDPELPPDGHVFDAPGPDRVALWAALHPVTGDQLLANDAATARAAGYGEPVLLGHLAAHAPVTGRLGVHAAPLVPWAGRRGVAIGA